MVNATEPDKKHHIPDVEKNSVENEIFWKLSAFKAIIGFFNY